ncbi:hypothetical protein PAXRUDRAFT_179876, partial [Paxillus rubicundulus Ve08.2h10]
TPLHISSWEGHSEVTKFLLEKGADPHVQDKDSETPLDCARIKGHHAIVDVLSAASSASPMIL